MKFSVEECEQILAWYQNISQDFMHYGDGTVMFPDEAILVKRLSAETNIDEEFEGSDLHLIQDWMFKNIRGKYGDSISLIGVEKDLYEKLSPNLPASTQ